MNILGNTDQEKFMWYKTMEGVIEKYGDDPPPYILDRIEHEMETITSNRFTDYILMIWDILDFCKTPDRVFEFCRLKNLTPPPDGIIPTGPGRGSVGGSLVCYVIGIHECDPLLFGLYFERFLNPERIAYPDIDCDISQKYRHLVLAYIADTYGEAHVSQIITYSTLSAKTVNEEVLKAANVPSSMIKAVKETIPDEEATMSALQKNKVYMQAMQNIIFPDSRMKVDIKVAEKILKNKNRISEISADDMANVTSVAIGIMSQCEITVKSSWNWEMAIDVMVRLEKLNKHESTHAGGVIVAPIVLEENVPLMKKDGDGVLACQYDMKSVEKLGLLKMDMLGLRTVDVNHETTRLIRQWYDPDFTTAHGISLEDEQAIKLIRDGDTVGIFQIESSGFTQMMKDLDIGGYEAMQRLISEIEKLRDLNITDFMWISAGLAMYRPGPLDAKIEGKTMVEHLVDRKAGREPVVYMFPEEQEYLSETYGIMIYQEQVMARVRQMTGCSMGRADVLRKAMGKKDPVLMKEQMDWFENEAMNHNFTSKELIIEQKRGIVQRAREEIEKFARYGFNKAHTVEYAHICYDNAYYKAHYPVAFYTALLNSIDDTKRRAVIIRDMVRHSIPLLPPLVSKSDMHFTMTDPSTIRFGLGAISGLGDKGLDAILEEKQIRGEFTSVENFRARVPSTLCNVNVMTGLAKCGAFDDIMGNDLVPIHDRATLVASIKDINDAINKLGRKKGKDKPKPSIEEVLAKINQGYASYTVTKAEGDPILYATWEKEVINFFISAHPLDAYRDEMRRWTAIEDTDMDDLPSECYIAGFVANCHETIIKKEGRNKGKTMGFLSVETEFRGYEATMFPGIYESCVPYIKTGNPVVMKCKKDYYKGSASLQVQYVRPLVNEGIRDCPECHMRLYDISPLRLMELKSMFMDHPGLTKVFIHIRHGIYDITIQCTGSIALNDRIIDYVDSIGELSYKETVGV